MGHFVDVPPDAIRARLLAAGFRLAAVPTSREEVYDRAHDRDRRYVVRVYTTIALGAARGCGDDAIRVVALFARDALVDSRAIDKAVGIFKAKRVHRSGSVEAVLERMMGRAREAYVFCSERRAAGQQAREFRQQELCDFGARRSS
jgi:hypothetical protein